MIRITIDLIPMGIRKDRITIAGGDIVNDGTGTNERGNYTYRFYAGKKIYKKGKVLNFNRMEKNIWQLIEKIIKEDNY